MEVFDAHRHLGHLGKIREVPVRQQVEHHLDVMDRYNLSSALMMPSHLYPNPAGLEDTKVINNQMAYTKEEYPGKFPVALGTVEPMYGEMGLPEIDRMMNDLSLDGISWHNRWQRSYVDAPIMYEYVERASSHGAVVLLHCYFESNLEEPWRIFNIVESFPEVDFIVADPFSGLKGGKKVTKWAANLDRSNLFFDTSGAKNVKKQLQPFIQAVGHEQLLFAAGGYSDSDTTSLPFPIKQIESLDLPQQKEEDILYNNAARIFPDCL